MSAKNIDLLNIALMLFSCVVAYILPFEVFLFSYAVLGPLHYLTEISWLHQRSYFTTGKFDFIIFILLGVILTALLLFGSGKAAQQWSNTIVFMCFTGALATVIFQNWLYKLLVLCVAMFLGFALSTFNGFELAFGVFLPTLIHVFLFTGIFIVYGALKSKSRTGFISAMVFIICGGSFFIFRPDIAWYKVGDYAIKSMIESKFVVPLISFMRLFNLGEITHESVFFGIAGKTVMRFIAFAYTYHYLNWFSKTSIIKWHVVPKRWLAVVLSIWVASVSIYAYDYYVGLQWLLLLSMLHVFMEFPLNFRAVIGIGQELKNLVVNANPAIVKTSAPTQAANKKKKQ